MQKDFRLLSKSKFENKVVALRCDFDVPIRDGEVYDDYAIKDVIPTIKFLLDRKCKVIVISGLDNPKGKYSDESSLIPVRFALGRLLNTHIKFANINQCSNSIKFVNFGEVLLIENILFSPEEISTDEEIRNTFAEQVSSHFDVFVLDTLSVDMNSPTVKGMASRIPSYLGLEVENDLKNASEFNNKIKTPVVSVFGGNNLDKKIGVFKELIKKSEKILIGGEIGLIFLKASGDKSIKKVFDEDKIKEVKELIKLARDKCSIYLPKDHIELDGEYIDIGEKTLKQYTEIIAEAGTVILNGALGKFESKEGSESTRYIIDFIANNISRDSFKIIAGKNTIAAVSHFKNKLSRFNIITLDLENFLKLSETGRIEILESFKK